MIEFFTRLKQRKLVQWVVAYVAGAWALLQVLDLAADSYHWPDLVMHLAFGVIALGLVVTLLLAWYHGSQGRQRVTSIELLILAGMFTMGGFLLWHYAGSGSSRSRATAASTLTPGDAGVTSALPVPVASTPARSIAVLPLAHGSGRAEERYFADGLTEDLINALAQYPGLKVISRNSSFAFRDARDDAAMIGRKLGVAHLLEGSVRRQAGQVRITVQLVKASDGSTLWSRHYDRPYEDLFALQDSVTRAVADELKATLLVDGRRAPQSDRPPGRDPDAFNAYMRGNALSREATREGYGSAIEAYADAVRIDPGYAAAWAAMGSSWTNVATQFQAGADARATYAKARAAIARALQLNPDLAVAHAAQAWLLLNADMNWRAAAAAARRAARLQPHAAAQLSMQSMTEASMGHVERAARLMQEAIQLDPRNHIDYKWLAMYLAGLGRLDEAHRAIATAIDLNPQATVNHYVLAVVEILRRHPDAALAAARAEPQRVFRNVALAAALHADQRHEAAERALKNLVGVDAAQSGYQIAQVHALRGQADEVFHWLDRAWQQRDPGVGFLLFDPFILRYRDDPRFAAFCKKVGLPTTTDAVAMK